MYMLTICVSSLEKYLFISSAYFLIILFGLSFFLLLICVNSLHILNSNPYKIYDLKHVLPLNKLLFHFVDGLFCCE